MKYLLLLPLMFLGLHSSQQGMGPGPGTPHSSGSSCTLPGSSTSVCPTVWFEPSNLYCTSALCTTTGTQATKWLDASGNGNNISSFSLNSGTDCTYTTNTLNSLPGLVVTNVGCEGNLTTALTWSTSETIMIVASYTTGSLTTDPTFISGSAANGYLAFRYNTSGALDLVVPGVADIGGSTTNLTASTFYQFNASYNSSTGAYSYRLSQATDGSGTSVQTISHTQTNTNYDAGATSGPFLGTEEEVIVFIPAISATEIGHWETYLNGKYGI